MISSTVYCVNITTCVCFCSLISPSDDVDVEPFTPVVAVPVDMFPQTLHCELVVLFER